MHAQCREYDVNMLLLLDKNSIICMVNQLGQKAMYQSSCHAVISFFESHNFGFSEDPYST